MFLYFSLFLGIYYDKFQNNNIEKHETRRRKSVGLPDNAFRPLKPGEQYHPIMSPNKNIPK